MSRQEEIEFVSPGRNRSKICHKREKEATNQWKHVIAELINGEEAETELGFVFTVINTWYSFRLLYSSQCGGLGKGRSG